MGRRVVVHVAEHVEVIANGLPKLQAVTDRPILESVDRVPPLLNSTILTRRGGNSATEKHFVISALDLS